MRLSSGFSDVSRGILQQLPGTLEDGRSSKGPLFLFVLPTAGKRCPTIFFFVLPTAGRKAM